jgi:hypothetical protein
MPERRNTRLAGHGPWPEEKHIMHLRARVVTACGRWSKFLTESAADVTCPDCRETWAFAMASRKDEVRSKGEG